MKQHDAAAGVLGQRAAGHIRAVESSLAAASVGRRDRWRACKRTGMDPRSRGSIHTTLTAAARSHAALPRHPRQRHALCSSPRQLPDGGPLLEPPPPPYSAARVIERHVFSILARPPPPRTALVREHPRTSARPPAPRRRHPPPVLRTPLAHPRTGPVNGTLPRRARHWNTEGTNWPMEAPGAPRRRWPSSSSPSSICAR